MTNLFMEYIAKAFPGISTSEVRKKLRYILPPNRTEPNDTPKYTWALTNLQINRNITGYNRQTGKIGK